MFFLNSHLLICLCVCAHMCAVECVWRSKDNVQESVLFFNPVSAGDWALVIRLDKRMPSLAEVSC